MKLRELASPSRAVYSCCIQSHSRKTTLPG